MKMNVKDIIQINIIPDSRILVFSDIHLTPNPTKSQLWIVSEIKEQIKKHIQYPGILILNGDILDLWRTDQKVVDIIRTHQSLFNLLKIYSKKHQIIYILGNHDSSLAWNNKAAKKVMQATGCEITLRGELKVGTKKIIAIHGHELDPNNKLNNPRDPDDQPFGQHLVQNAFPIIKSYNFKITEDFDYFSEPLALLELFFARIFYKFLMPVVLILKLLFFMSLIILLTGIIADNLWHFIAWLVLIISFVFILTVALLADQIKNKIIKNKLADNRSDYNDNLKKYLKEMSHNNKNIIGLVTGHTHVGELKKLNSNFFANSGFSDQSLERTHVKLGLPDTFIMLKQVSWLEIEYLSDKIYIIMNKKIYPSKKISPIKKFFFRNLYFGSIKQTLEVK